MLTTTGTYRVLASPRGPDEWLLLDEEYEPTYVTAAGYDGAIADRVAALRPGYLVRATLVWGEDGPARFEELDVRDRTLFEFVDGATGLFEAAREAWQEAERDGRPMNSQVTYDTGGDPNGALYVFAEGAGGRSVFEEFRDGSRPLDPLVERADAEPCEVFVMRPADGQFVVVYVVLARDSLLADTMRDTYDCPRPSEPLA